MRSGMPKDSPVLIDTSVWIDYFLKRDAHLEKTVDLLLDNDRVVTAAVIMAELVQGAASEREVDQLTGYFRPLYRIQGRDSHWVEAGFLSFRLRKKGKTVNLTDCYISCLASSAPSLVYTRDKHFRWISEIGAWELFE